MLRTREETRRGGRQPFGFPAVEQTPSGADSSASETCRLLEFHLMIWTELNLASDLVLPL